MFFYKKMMLALASCVIVEGEKPGDVGGGKTAGPIVKAALDRYFETRPVR